MKTARNKKNDGRGFEAEFKTVSEAYFRGGRLRLEKVEPPCRVLYIPGGGQRVIFLENPYADWTGAWTERGGRTLMIETKSTSEDRLSISTASHLREKQIDWLINWHRSGAAVGVVWEWKNYGVGFLPIGRIEEIRRSGRRHIKWSEVDEVGQGKGFVLFDWLKRLEEYYPA